MALPPVPVVFVHLTPDRRAADDAAGFLAPMGNVFNRLTAARSLT